MLNNPTTTQEVGLFSLHSLYYLELGRQTHGFCQALYDIFFDCKLKRQHEL